MESEETNEQEQPPAKSPAHPEDNEDQGEEPDMDRLAKEMEEAEKEDCSGEECVGIPINEPASPRQQEPATSVDEATEHEFEKEFFSPFSPVMCKYCKKFIYTIRKAYSCKRESTTPVPECPFSVSHVALPPFPPLLSLSRLQVSSAQELQEESWQELSPRLGYAAHKKATCGGG